MKKLMIPSILLLMFALFQTTQAQSGRITDVDNKGIPGVIVTGNLNCKGGIPIGEGAIFPLSAETAVDGSYIFTLPPVAGTSLCGTRTITVTARSKQNYVFFNDVGIQLPLFQSASGADYKAVAASEMVAAGFSQDLSMTTEGATTFPLPTTLGGRSVVVSHTALMGAEKNAEIIFVSPEQINYVIPAGLPPGRAFVKVRDGDRLVRAGVIELNPIAPGLFTLTADGAGIPAAFAQRVKSDGRASYELIARFDPDQGKFVAIPIDLDSETDKVFLGLLGTGLRNRRALEVVTAKIGGMPVEVLYAGPQGMPGVDQVNLRVPGALRGRGEVDVEVMVEGNAVNMVKIVIK